MIQPIDILNRLKNNGWVQGEYGPDCGPNCIRGAQIALQGETFLLEDANESEVWKISRDSATVRNAIEEVISEQFPERPVSIPGFNDDPRTSFEDVEKVLEKAQLRLDDRV